ncbi:MAG: ferrochelatase [Thermomicrobiales bacterium]|nr:ferrochelatase [Thermomicrobiales bacterium]
MTIFGATSQDNRRFDDEARTYDALLVLSFGGPEGPGDVMPFLENVTRGRNIPRTRLEEVAEHYLHFGGVSPINAQNRALIAAIEREFAVAGIDLPVYFGNRNWEPFVTDTVRQMRDDGVRRGLVFVTSALSSYSGCRQYREDMARALAEVGDGAPEFDKVRTFYNHPGFIEPMTELTRQAFAGIPADRLPTTRLIFTAHSIPESMARHCAYELQLAEASRLIAEGAGFPIHQLAYQSRSGPPQVPWLEPDILDVLADVVKDGVTDAVVVPVGFISDHMEILFDLDTEALETAESLGLHFHRVPTVGVHRRFVRMIRELVQERMTANPVRPSVGKRGPTHDICPVNCCLLGAGARNAGAQIPVPATA